MPKPSRLPKAPITEAVLDIRVRLPKSVDLAQLDSCHDRVRERYPSKETRTTRKFAVALSANTELAEVQQSGGPDGVLFRSADGRQVVQARLDGFSFSRLKPYETWEKLRDEAKDLWALYVQTASPQAVVRIALRSINRIPIPLPLKDFKEYTLTTPEIAQELPQGMASFFMRLVIPDRSTQAVAILTQTMEPIEKGVSTM